MWSIKANVLNKKKQIYIIGILLVSISVLHYFTSAQELKLHELYRRLYYLPIIYGAFQFRLAGGLLLPMVISFIYLPYLIYFGGHSSPEIISNLFEVVMFYTIGSVTGILVEKLHLSTMENRHLQEEIKRADRLSAIGQLASGVAHEIRNPLAIIKTTVQTLNSHNEEEKEAHEIIQEEIGRASAVIEELLNFSKNGRLKKKPVDLVAIIQGTITLTNKLAQQKEIEIQLLTNHSGSLMLLGDEEKLKQAFINIIFNAIDAIEKKGIIDITMTRYNQSISICFSDTGRGIEDNQLEQIFNPFYTTKEKGVGLGMSITFRIIEEHGGQIQINSIKDQGTQVRVILPRLKEGGEKW